MGAANCLITNIFQNIFFCVKQKKETHTVLEQLEGEEIITISFLGELKNDDTIWIWYLEHRFYQLTVFCCL